MKVTFSIASRSPIPDWYHAMDKAKDLLETEDTRVTRCNVVLVKTSAEWEYEDRELYFKFDYEAEGY